MALIHCDFYSEVLQLNTSICAIIPQHPYSEIQSRKPDRKYQTLYLLHGLSDDHTIWQRRTSIERHAPFGLAVIMPDVNRSFYTDMACGNRYGTFISDELPYLCRSFFHLSEAREDNFIAGLSMGGYGAFKLALTYPERYMAAASLSGALDITQTVQAGDEAWQTELTAIFGNPDNVAGSEHDLFHLTRQLVQADRVRPSLYQCCGTEDFLYDQNIRFQEFAGSVELDLTYEEGPGEHEWGYWDQQIQRVLDWLPLNHEPIGSND